MTTKTAKTKAPRGPRREGMQPAARPKKAPVADGLTREQIDAANAAGPGAVAGLIKGRGAPKAAKATKGKVAAKARVPTKAPAKPSTTTAKADAPTRDRDPRLPRPGGVITRTYQGKELKVQVLDAGFGYDGKTWRSLSAIAKAVSGTSWNGFLFFGLQTRAKAPAKPPAKDDAKGGAK